MTNLYNEQNIFEIVRKELNKVDPIGVVLDNDNLNDEYDLENKEIVKLINHYTDYKKFTNKICEIFIKSTEIKLNPKQFLTY